LPIPSLDRYAVSVNVVLTEDFVVDHKDTIGAVANYFRNSIVASGKREGNGPHEHIGFAASRRTIRTANPPVLRQRSRLKTNHDLIVEAAGPVAR
jgi:hypothetical protein